MDARLQRRVQRYGWDLAATSYESLWHAQLAPAQSAALLQAALAPGERVLDVACGTGLVARAAAGLVGPHGEVMGIDLSGRMVDAANRQARRLRVGNTSFARMDAEALALPPATFDVVLCALGLMYVPSPEQALREMLRVLRPGGRMVSAVWGERARCAWSAVFPIVEAEVTSDVCPLFFRLGPPGALARACADAGFVHIVEQRIEVTLDYSSAQQACDAAFAGGPVALAWSRFDEPTRARAHTRYVEAIGPWRQGSGFRLPGEFVVVSATAPPAGL